MQKSRSGFVEIANKDCLDEQYGHLPVQPGDESRVWGANSFAALPTFEGKFRADVAQQRGYRMPTLPDDEAGANSGVCLAVADADAGATAPGVVPESGGSEEADGRSLAEENAAMSGKVFAPRLGDWSSDPSASDELGKNARKYAERFALEAGFRRCSPRAGVPNTRASRFELDAPPFQASVEWLSYAAINELRLSKDQQVQPRRIAESAPTSFPLRGSLEGEGFVYQFATRAAALVFLLVSVMLTPSASVCNRAMLAQIITRAFGVRDQKMACGSADKPEADSPSPRGWEFNSVLDSVVGLSAVGVAVNKPGEDDGMLRSSRAAPRRVWARNTMRSRWLVSRGRPRMVCLRPRARRPTTPVKNCAKSWSTNGRSWRNRARRARQPARRDGRLDVPSDSRLVALAAAVCW